MLTGNNGRTADTPYGCWLRFTQSVNTYRTVGDSALGQCAKKWYSASPSHPAAALLYSWSLTDDAAFKLREQEREEGLARALNVIQSSSAIHAGFASLDLTRMRAHSFLGHRAQVIESANDALMKARGNRVLIAMAGSGLALWNDPKGERILSELVVGNERKLPAEHVGLFVAAMMHDNSDAAGVQLSGLEHTSPEQPMLLLLKAAYHARTGQRTEAETLLRKLDQDHSVGMTGHDLLIDRLPMAPEVKARLRSWLTTQPV